MIRIVDIIKNKNESHTNDNMVAHFSMEYVCELESVSICESVSDKK